MATEIVPVNASIASTGLGIRYVGEFAYAYSGPIPCNNVETTLIETLTGSGTIVGSFQPDYAEAIVYSEDLLFQVYMNDQVIYMTTLSAATSYTPTEEIEIILPPLTKFKITGTNTTNTSNRKGAIVFTGRVYGAK